MTQPMTMTPEEQIDFFFAPPFPPQTGTQKSLLHLNRQEAQDCLIGRLDVPEHDVVSDKCHRLFATTMVIAAGVDLLGKFFAGSASRKRGESQARFTDFAKRFVFANEDSRETFAGVLWGGCRNPMMHAFGLRNDDGYAVSLTEMRLGGAAILSRTVDSGTAYVVSVPGLYTAYLGAIGRYQEALRADATLQENFRKMFPDYGFIRVMNQTGEV
jgi:hypothetical protein